MSAEPARYELREVEGPSALGGGSRRFFDLLWLISLNEFRKTFYGTFLGYVWSLIRPLLLFGVLLVVFTKIIRLGSDVPHYPVMLLFNLVLFGLFQEASGGAVGSVLAQEGIVRKTQFPRLVIPLSSVLVFLLASNVEPMWTWLLFPVILALLLGITCGVSLLLSALNVRFRDVAIIWTVLATVLMYGTPLIYPLDIIGPSFLREVLLLNPLTLIFEQAREWIIDPNAASAVDAAGGWLHVLPAAAIYVAVCIAGVWVFRREAPKIAELL
jgi:ABC-2 type transport system permease protein